jgi:glucosylceramidase
VQAYLEENINIYGISIQNEPFHSPDDYPGMLMNTTQQINIIKHLGFRFREYNINTKILLLDHNWDLYEKAIEVLQDQDAYSYIDGIAWHGYSGPNPRIQDTIKKEFPEKDHYFTEITGFKGAPNFHDNLVWWYKNIYIGSIQNWAKTVLLWNIVLDENGGPMLRDYTDMRGVITVKSPNDVQFEGEYYAIGQMSKFVPRNSVRVGTRTNSDDLYTVAFRTPDGSTILVVLNGSDSGIEFEIVHGLNRMQYSISAKSVFTFCYNF